MANFVTFDLVVGLTSTVVMIIGGYQFYFWCQRRTKGRARSFSFRMENAIRLRPAWVWIYSGLYYPAIVAAVLSARDFRYFNYMAFSYFVLLAFQMAAFLTFPVEVPPEWRQGIVREASTSQRFLAFVHGFDARSNCFPSMHVSVATLTALHIARNLPSLAIAGAVFVVLIVFSCIFTKQHYLMDIPVALMLGWFCFQIFLRIL